MGIRFYDEALLIKLQNWVKDPNATVLGPGGLMLTSPDAGRAFQILSDKESDAGIKLPIIMLSRNGDVSVDNISKRPLTHNGAVQLYSTDQTKTAQLNAIPITLEYQLDVITKYYNEADEYIRNFVFNIINYPKLQVNIPYNGLNYVHNSNITLDPTITDSSDNPQRLFPGQFSDWSIKFIVDDAYLFSVPFTRTWNIESPVYIKIKDGNTYIEEEVNLSI